ncbi:MAG: ATP-binding protein [Deltaproteobacteria bacterium]|nr:ATP-binding protein [Deltaproteobacteria bacterium]
MLPKRSLFQLLEERHFPHHKMAFLVGPRQAGKTFLAKALLKEHSCSPLYYNWDDAYQKKKLLKDAYSFEKDFPSAKQPLVVFDEIHKYSRWKNFLKGVYDRFYPEVDFLITGSGRLDVYKKGSDSLFGRFFIYHLLPLSVGELLENGLTPLSKQFQNFEENKKARILYENLWNYSGFPDPYLKKDEAYYQQWENLRRELVLRQDVRDLSSVKELGMMEHLFHLLPERVGSPLSINSLTQDIETTFKTIQNWIHILERVYYLFCISPYSKKMARAIKKEKKVFLWNWRELEDEGKRFENLVAVHLKKFVSLYNDFGLAKLSLHYLRDKNKREVDFILLKNEKPWVLIEAKLSDQAVSKDLLYYSDLLKPEHVFQIVSTPNVYFKKTTETQKAWVMSADRFLAGLV